jgi:hypothetical protein
MDTDHGYGRNERRRQDGTATATALSADFAETRRLRLRQGAGGTARRDDYGDRRRRGKRHDDTTTGETSGTTARHGPFDGLRAFGYGHGNNGGPQIAPICADYGHGGGQEGRQRHGVANQGFSQMDPPHVRRAGPPHVRRAGTDHGDGGEPGERRDDTATARGRGNDRTRTPRLRRRRRSADFAETRRLRLRQGAGGTARRHGPSTGSGPSARRGPEDSERHDKG